jgi:hypothetical protein
MKQNKARMNLPYYMYCSEMSANLYPLKDGKFQIITQGKLVPLMVGYNYALVEKTFAEYLEQLDLPQLDIKDAIIYNPADKKEIRTYSQLKTGQHFSADMLGDIGLDGERIFLMNNSYLFVSEQLKRRLEDSEFQYLRFSEGLSEFAG